VFTPTHDVFMGVVPDARYRRSDGQKSSLGLSVNFFIFISVFACKLALRGESILHIQLLIHYYGYFGVLFILLLEMIGIPFPAETTLTIS